jgi:Rad52/22 family double-strand break repair protein
MNPPNGKPNGSANDRRMHPQPAIVGAAHGEWTFTPEESRSFVSKLEIPFDPAVINWRVTNTSKNGKLRGMVIPYADQRAYTDRLNELFSPGGWTRRYAVHTSANFERDTDKKIVAKVFVTCELTVFGIGSHSATGEEWTDDPNAGTSAEAQSFKRAAACFGLGRYLYYFEGMWVDLDDRKRPRTVPRLPDWATPEGWTRGLRPNLAGNGTESSDSTRPESGGVLVAEIESLAQTLGRGLYRGLLRDLARVWNPREILDLCTQRKVLEHMRAAERGLERLEEALRNTGPEALIRVLDSLGFRSLERVDKLEDLKRIVLAMEGVVKPSS